MAAKDGAGVLTTPVKTERLYFSPSGGSICISCQIKPLPKRKFNLWKDRSLTRAGFVVSSIGLELDVKTDFKVVCQACLQKFEGLKKKQEQLKDNIRYGREESKQFIRRKFKRGIKESKEDDDGKSSSRRKKLFTEINEQGDNDSTDVEQTCSTRDEKVEVVLPKKFEKLAKIMKKGNVTELLKALRRSFREEYFDHIKWSVEKILKEEAKLLCQSAIFRLEKTNDVASFDFEKQHQFIKEKAPLVEAFVRSIAVNPRIKRNKHKKDETCLPAMMTAVSALLYTRNRLMNLMPFVLTCILRRGQAKKETFGRFQKLGLSLSYTTMLQKLSEFGEDHDSVVKGWSDEIKREHDNFEKEMNNQLMAPINVPIVKISGDNHNGESMTVTEELDSQFLQLSLYRENLSDVPVCNNRYMLVGDNVDLTLKRRHYTKANQNSDLHIFHVIAVKNRIPIPENLKHQHATNEIPDYSQFLPSVNDYEKLREEFKILMARDLVKNNEDLKWMEKFVPKYIPHQYDDLVKEKSNVNSLGIINENENTNDGIHKIMREAHKYVPGSGADRLTRVFTVGDLLTVERSQNVNVDLLDHPNAESRLEGLIPAIADFHTYGNFLEVIWHLLYNTHSAADIGTLYQARTYLNARSVPATPMKDVNACEELVMKYSEALTLALFDSIQSVSSDRDEKSFHEIMDQIVAFAVPDSSTMKDVDSTYNCHQCNKKYQKLKRLVNHLRESGHSQNDPSADGVSNYCVNALALCYLAKDFRDARRRGDGGRIHRLYKHMLLYFKLDGRTKYSYQSLHFLAQVEFLLPPGLAHELKWNRFVNIKGRPDTNIEMDRELEHRNKYVKEDIKAFRGKITDKSIARCSKSYNPMENLIKMYDEKSGHKTQSGRHTAPDWKDDVSELANQFKKEKLFQNESGRCFKNFPALPKNYLSKLKMENVRTWATSRLETFKKMNLYKHKGINIANT